MGFLKWLLVLALCLAGMVFLLVGAGVGIDTLDIQQLHATGIPAGAVVMLTAVAIAHYWRIKSRKVVTTMRHTGAGQEWTTSVRIEEVMYIPSRDGPPPAAQDLFTRP